ARQQPEGACLHAVSNSRRMVLSPTGLAGNSWRHRLNDSSRVADVNELARFIAALPARRHLLVDVTASPEVAAHHAEWLADGFEVITANKWAAAGELEFAPDLHSPRYRHATTVGAGLPILQTLRGLRRAGDCLLGIEGVLSGTMSFLTSQVASGKPFSRALVDAHAAGLTEPDPRLDLGGLDVARKLVIAARAAGLALRLDEVDVDSLVPTAAADLAVPAFLSRSDALDARWREAAAGCPGRGATVIHAGHVSVDESGRVHARVGLRRVPPEHPLAAISPGDNIVSIRT